MRSVVCNRRQTRMALRAPGANSASMMSVISRSGMGAHSCPERAAEQPDSISKMRVGTGFATPAGNAFADDDWQHAKSGNWIGPPPAKNGVECEAEKQYHREISADIALMRVSMKSIAVQPHGDATLSSRQKRHNNYTRSRIQDAEVTDARRFVF